MDISSDLTELGKTPVTVISAGVKSILDIPRTLEYLVLPITPTLQKNGSLIC
jgi:pseudouridine-5'-phosphate glycosidase